MAGVLTTEQKATQRTPGQWSRAFLAIPEYHTIYTALLNGVPEDNDMVAEIEFDAGSGTLADVLPDMMLYVGTSAGAYDLGVCRIRKAPISGFFYVGETSEIIWQDNAYLTVVDDYSLWQKSIRIIGSEAFMDWIVEYEDQHESFDPVPAMGTHRVARLPASGSVEVVLGPSLDTDPFVFGSTIASQAWTLAGGTLDNAALLNPTATFTATGTYLAYCTFTAANGKTFTGVRYVIIYDDDSPLIESFTLRNGGGNTDKGGFSFGVELFDQFDTLNLRERSLVILCTEDYADGHPVVMPGQIEGAENIVCVGWIADIDNQRGSETKQIRFTVESAEYWLKKIRDYPAGLELKIGDPQKWTDMPSMTVGRACWHFLHWRSTATRVLDVQLTGDPRLASRFTTARANLWERLVAVTQPVIFARPMVDNFGRLFIDIDPQMEDEADRDFPVAMTITDDDIEGNIQWVRRDVETLSMLFMSGIAVDETGGASSYFSMSPGHSYGHYGDEESQDNYLLSDQEQANSKCGLYYGWRNNSPYNLQINFVHSMRYAGLAPRQYFYFEISAQDDPRGIGYAGNLIPRDIGFSMDPDTKFLSISVGFEPESFPGPSVDGDVPTMEDIDFTTPDLPDLPGLPELPPLPIYEIPPGIPTEIQPKEIIIASDNLGIFYTQNADEAGADVEFFSMNLGLEGFDSIEVVQIVKTPSGALYAMTGGDSINGWDKIIRASGLGGTWETVFVADEYSTDAKISGLGVNPTANDEIAIVVGEAYVGFGTLDTHRIYTGGGTSYSAGDVIRLKFRTGQKAVLFCFGSWIIAGHRPTGIGGSSAEPRIWQYNSAGGLIGDPDGVAWGVGVSSNVGDIHGITGGGKVVLWGGGVIGYVIINDEAGVSQDHIQTEISPATVQGAAMSPTGERAMGRDGVTPYGSIDGLLTWYTVAGVIPVGSDVWESCGDDFRWLFGGGTVLRLTMDQGYTYLEKSGNLSDIAPLIDITFIRYLS